MVEETYYWDEKNMTSITDYIRHLSEVVENLSDVLLEDFQTPSFINWLEDLGYGSVYNEWYNLYYRENGVYKDEKWVGHALMLLEKISSENHDRIVSLYIEYIKRQPQYWVKENIDLYQMDTQLEHILVDSLEQLEFRTSNSLNELSASYEELCQLYLDLKREFMNNLWLYQFNLYEVSKYRITSAYPDAYFVLSNNQSVPVGYIKTQAKSYSPERLNIEAVSMREEAVKHLELLKQQAGLWKNEMLAIKKKKTTSKNIPNGKLAILSAIISALVLLYCLVGVIRVGNWDYAILLRIIYIGSMVISGICLIQFLRQLASYGIWQKLQGCYKEIALFSKDLEEHLVELRKNITTNNNLLLSKEPIVSKKENGMVNAQVTQATFKQLAQNKKIKKGTKIYIIIILITLILNVALTTFISKGQKTPTKIPTKTVKTQESDTITYTVNVANANVRSGPGTSYSRIDTYKKGQQFEGTGKSEKDKSNRTWYEIILDDGQTGWICETTVE